MKALAKWLVPAAMAAAAPALAVLAAFPAVAQPQTPSEDNLGVKTEDGLRTTDPQYNRPQTNIGGGGGSNAIGHPGSGSQAAMALTNQLFNGALAGQPLVPAARNPLLGRWRTTGGNLGMDLNSIGPFGQASSGLLNGSCEAMFGKEVTFGPSSFERVAANGRKQVLQHVEYHGNSSTIAVLVKGSGTQPTIMSLRDPNHASSAMGCTLEREPGGPGRPAGAQLANAPLPGAQVANGGPSGPANATIRFQVGVNSGGRLAPLVNAPVWVMTRNPIAQLAATGFRPPPGTPFLAKLASDCRVVQTCQQEVGAMVKGALGRLFTGADGAAQTPQIAAGHYWVVGVSNIQGKPIVWAQQVDIQPGANTVTLDQLSGWSPS